MSIPQATTSRHTQAVPVAVHNHHNQPVVYPYKPSSSPPPGAHLYKNVWLVFKTSVQAFLGSCEPQSYALGFTVGALKAARQWSLDGPSKKVPSDDEIVDFGATAHSSSIWSQVTILAENLIAVAIPLKIRDFFPSDNCQPYPHQSPQNNEFLVRSCQTNSSRSFADLTANAFVFYHGVMFGEEVINMFSRWADVSKPKK